jgi:hypothetical protein
VCMLRQRVQNAWLDSGRVATTPLPAWIALQVHFLPAVPQIARYAPLAISPIAVVRRLALIAVLVALQERREQLLARTAALDSTRAQVQLNAHHVTSVDLTARVTGHSVSIARLGATLPSKARVSATTAWQVDTPLVALESVLFAMLAIINQTTVPVSAFLAAPDTYNRNKEPLLV